MLTNVTQNRYNINYSTTLFVDFIFSIYQANVARLLLLLTLAGAASSSSASCSLTLVLSSAHGRCYAKQQKVSFWLFLEVL
jgi:hypothetical protein